MLQAVSLAHEKWGISRVYAGIGERGWLWWALSIPLYVLLWDLTFYVLHLLLHVPIVFRISHFRHHKCRSVCALVRHRHRSDRDRLLGDPPLHRPALRPALPRLLPSAR